MTKTERMALVYGLSVGGAALASYLRGRRGLAEVGMDAALHGGLVGTGINVVLYMKDSAGSIQAVQMPAVRALPNKGQDDCPPYGKIAAKGLALLSEIKPEVLYKAAKMTGVSVGPSPEDVHNVVLPRE